MENKLSQINIMNVYKREKEGKYLKKLIEVSASKYGIPVNISFDDGSLGVWNNYVQSLTMNSDLEGTHRIVIQDDMSFDRNILEKILYVFKFLPKDKILVLYNPTNSDYKNCNEHGKHILTTDVNFWCQCAIYPNDLAKKFCEEMDIYARDNRHDDDRLSAWLQHYKEKLFVLVPSLVQHLGAFRSNFNTNGKVAGVVRNSSTYDSQFDVFSVDWEKEFANPYEAKMKKDYTKDVIRQEFFNEYGKW